MLLTTGRKELGQGWERRPCDGTMAMSRVKTGYLFLALLFFLNLDKKQKLSSEGQFYSHVILQQLSISFSVEDQLFLLSRQREGGQVQAQISLRCV